MVIVGVRVLERSRRDHARRVGVRAAASACAAPEDRSHVVLAPVRPAAAEDRPVEVPGQLELFPGPPPPADDVLDLPETEVWWEVAVPDLAPAGGVRRVQQLHALVARAESLRVEALAALQRSGRHRADDAPADRPAAGVADDALVDELAPLLAMGRTALRRRLQEADQLSRCLPRSAALLAEGVVDYPQVAAVVRETARLTEEQALDVDATVVGDLVGETTGAVAELVRAEVARVDADALRERSRALTRGRHVLFTPLADGMASLTAVGPAPQVRSWWELVDAGSRDRTRPAAQQDPYAQALADRGAHDPGPGGVAGDPGADRVADRGVDARGSGARRFDALGELVEQGFGAAPGVGLGAGPELVVALSTLVGEDDDPARLDGHGLVPGWLARAAARARRARVALVDRHDGRLLGVDPQTQPPGAFTSLAVRDSGTVSAPTSSGGAATGATSPDPSSDPPHGPWDGAADGPVLRTVAGPAAADRSSGIGDHGWCAVAVYGGGGYAVPAGVRRAVRMRSRRCCAPGCRVPSKRCDLDHVVAWPAGPTCPCNLLPLCRTHHRMKHERGWSLALVTDDPDDPLGVDGVVAEWRSPAGAQYLVRPGPLLHRRSGGCAAGPSGPAGVAHPTGDGPDLAITGDRGGSGTSTVEEVAHARAARGGRDAEGGADAMRDGAAPGGGSRADGGQQRPGEGNPPY